MKRQPAAPYEGETTIGIDVSHWQGEVDWEAVAHSSARFDGSDVGPVRFAVVRTGDGKDTDRLAVRNLIGAHAAGLPCGLYHYIRAKHGAAVNLGVIRDVIATAGVPIGFVAIDVEGQPAKGERDDHGAWMGLGAAPGSTSAVMACVNAMGAKLEADGHRVVVYSGAAWHWHVSQAQAGGVPEHWPLWTAYYTRRDRPNVPVRPDGSPAFDPAWMIWQFAGSKPLPGSVGGIRGNVDLNHFRGDEEALRAWMDPAHRTTLPPPAFERSEIGELRDRAKGAGDVEAATELHRAILRLEKC